MTMSMAEPKYEERLIVNTDVLPEAGQGYTNGEDSWASIVAQPVLFASIVTEL